MADEREDLRLNTLHRFAKRATRLVLEEHSSCEVPAGCGGVVLRWRDPAAGIDVSVRLSTLGRAALWIDGAPTQGSQATLAPGAHVLAFRVTELPDHASPVCLAVHNRTDSTGDGRLLSSRDDDTLRVVLSDAAQPPPIASSQPLIRFRGDAAEAAGQRRWLFEDRWEPHEILELPAAQTLWVMRAVTLDARGAMT